MSGFLDVICKLIQRLSKAFNSWSKVLKAVFLGAFVGGLPTVFLSRPASLAGSYTLIKILLDQ